MRKGLGETYGGQAVKLEGQFPIRMLHWNVGTHRDAI